MSLADSVISAFLVMMRLTPLFIGAVLSPFAQVPVMVRINLLLLLSAAMISGMDALPAVTTLSILQFVLMAISELVIGLVMVMGVVFLLGAADFVGKSLDAQIGFAAAQVFNPLSRSVTGIVANLLSILLILLMWLSGLHLDLIVFIHESFGIIGLGELPSLSDPMHLLGHLNGLFIFTLLLLLPAMVALMMVDLIAGVVSRSMPQMNVYFVTLPLKIGVGLLLLAYTLRHGAAALADLVRRSLDVLMVL